MEVILNVLKAFLVGGAFCLVGQIFIDKTGLTPARILVSYVVAGVILGAIGVYKPLAEFAGAGATVPLTGFGYLLSDGVRKAVDAYGLWGVLTGGLTAAAAGIAASIIFGLIMGLIFKSKEKNST
ncbi:MAG: stage V sporulation protein AE [Oscillospiraceae bacterium]|nr:stage V sporulation protein AE [Oscillospiraceae bacterium]